MIKTIETIMFGIPIGVIQIGNNGVCSFEYYPSFCEKKIEPSPLMMPAVPERIYSFADISRATFKGLPGMMADSLPDSFGQALLNRWLDSQGRSDANVLEMLSFQGRRCMGALEYVPAREFGTDESSLIEMDSLIETARTILAEKTDFKTCIRNNPDAVMEILKISTSAGGQRAKAVIAMNDQTKEIRSGQVSAPDGFDYWLLKFDGFDSEARPVKPASFGRREYAFSRSVKEAGIDMTECRLWEESGRAHFLTKRFDRLNGKKIHMQTLCALRHYDYHLKGAYSYEQAFRVLRELRLPYPSYQEFFKRMVFNVLSVNMDDHTKNISFLMNDKGEWSLSPAYDMGFSYNPHGAWANSHQMTICGKTDHITGYDILELAKRMEIDDAREICQRVEYAIMRYPEFAQEAGVPHAEIDAMMNIILSKVKEASLSGPVPSNMVSRGYSDTDSLVSLGVPDDVISEIMKGENVVCCSDHFYRKMNEWDTTPPPRNNTEMFFRMENGKVMVKNKWSGLFVELRSIMHKEDLSDFMKKSTKKKSIKKTKTENVLKKHQ